MEKLYGIKSRTKLCQPGKSLEETPSTHPFSSLKNVEKSTVPQIWFFDFPLTGLTDFQPKNWIFLNRY